MGFFSKRNSSRSFKEEIPTNKWWVQDTGFWAVVQNFVGEEIGVDRDREGGWENFFAGKAKSKEVIKILVLENRSIIFLLV